MPLFRHAGDMAPAARSGLSRKPAVPVDRAFRSSFSRQLPDVERAGFVVAGDAADALALPTAFGASA